MALFFISLLAGLLTVLAPCILPLLPVVVGSSAAGRSRSTPFVVVGSLAVSIILFTYVLKVSTAFITIPPYVWTLFSGSILVLFGLSLVFPAVWEHIPGLNRLSAGSNKLIGKGYQRKSLLGDVLIGAALGPVFSSCSPTYFVILASVLPASFALGTLYLFAYVVGLSVSLLAIALLGQRFADRLSGIADPKSVAKRLIGVLFIVLGILIVTGTEKKLEAGLLAGGFFDVTRIEQALLAHDESMPPVNGVNAGSLTSEEKALRYKKAPELARADAYLNTNGQSLSLADYRGKKVVLIDFWTYSCINCQRTLPYLKTWYDKYEDQGLVIIGIHTPEFAFEHERKNVEAALKNFGITYPVLLDNEYQTWNAFSNQFWPRKYLIDIDGYIVYDHAGEGEYDSTEKAIQAALTERARRLGNIATDIATSTVSFADPHLRDVASPEVYFGSLRNEYFGNGLPGFSGQSSYTFPESLTPNKYYLSGTWNIGREYATAKSEGAIRFIYTAHDVYIVASASSPTEVTVLRDGVPVGLHAGTDVNATTSTVTIQANRLYHLVHDVDAETHTLELKMPVPGLEAYTFTFG